MTLHLCLELEGHATTGEWGRRGVHSGWTAARAATGREGSSGCQWQNAKQTGVYGWLGHCLQVLRWRSLHIFYTSSGFNQEWIKHLTVKICHSCPFSIVEQTAGTVAVSQLLIHSSQFTYILNTTYNWCMWFSIKNATCTAYSYIHVEVTLIWI